MSVRIPFFQKAPLYPGTVIFSDQDADGPIDVVDRDHFRNLHFGNQARQSTIILNAPQRLVLSYTRAAMLPLLTLPVLNRVLVMGLGGGSIPRFLCYHFPHCQVDVVEKRLKIIEIANRFFQLPDAPNLTIYCADAFRFFETHQPARYDWIIVDIYGGDGLLKLLNTDYFICSLKDHLLPDGVLAFNLIERPRLRFRGIATKIDRHF